jgi:hypothetical protein
MARTPAYPKDAPVASAKGEPTPAPKPAPAPAADDQGKPAESKRAKHLMTGAAIGIGSAAIVAALLYANRKNRDRS